MRLNNLQLKKNNLNLSNELDKERIPEHIAIIMDGNGRWATKKGVT
jgi:undecaprenyl diphosphate synthase